MIGIVASRLVERYNRPVVMIAGGDGDWKGSGRSVPAFDLHAALAACAAHLERFGGHRAAAGLTIAGDRVEAFAAAFAAHADEALTDDDLRPVTRVDAIVPGSELNLELCAELGRLAPFGLGNPGVLLLVDGCELADLSTVGDGKHLRFRVRQRGRDSGSAIAFGMGGQLDRFRRDQAATTSRSACRRTAGTASRRRSSSCGASSTPPTASTSCATGSAASGRRVRRRGRRRPVRSSRSSSSTDGARRSLLESPAFRALLEEKPALAAAA